MYNFQHKIKFLFLVLFSGAAFAQQQKDTKNEIFNLLATSDSLLFLSEFKESMAFSNQALTKALAIEDVKLVALCYNSIAGSFEELFEEDKALSYYEKAIFYTNKAKNDTLKIWIYNNIGNIYFYKKDNPDQGIFYYDVAHTTAEIQKDTAALVLIKMNLTGAYFKKNDFKKGFLYLDFAEKNINHLRYPDTETYLNLLLGVKNSHLKNNQKATFHFKEAINIALDNGINSYLAEAYQKYSNHLFELGNFEKAYEYLDYHLTIKNKMYTTEKIKSAEILGMKIELDESNRKLQTFKKESLLQKESLKKTKIIVFLYLVLLVVMFFLIFSLHKNNQFKKKLNKFLTLKNEELKSAKIKAEEVSKLKSQFISTISHELRTPLYGVVGITNMLADEHPQLAESQHLNSLKFSARYLLSLVNDLLQLNRIEEKKVVLETLTFNLVDEIQMVAKSLNFIANRNNNLINVDIDDSIPELIVGDKLRLSQIFMNLVSNGLKFTQNGSVLIAAKLNRFDATSCFIDFRVRDTGMGISPEDLTKIFEKFVQIDRKEDDYQGAGLGLSIVKKLIELFNSQITVSSELEKGTEFKFTIGFESDIKKVKEIIENIEVDLSTSKTYRILVVEDNKINQMVTKKILDKNNFISTIVDDGYAAIEALSKEKFDVILMDINMPLINGFDTTRLIRKKEIVTPIIALTAFAKDEITEEALTVGMNDILVKPFEAIKLIQMIERLF